MKRDFTFSRVLVLLAVAVSFALNVKAGSTWYAYYAQLNAYPTGAGQVYVDQQPNLAPQAITEWGEHSETQFVATSGGVYGYVKPAQGWILAGFSEATVDENGENPTFNDKITVKTQPGLLTLPNTVTDDPASTGSSDSSVVAGMMPLDPNGVFYAIFTHVVAEVAAGQDSLGMVEISKVSNDIGDNVTLTATPRTIHANTKFDRWTLNGNTVSTAPTLELNVTDTARYVAHFTSDDAETIDFGEGKYMMIYPGDDIDISIPSNVKTLTFVSDSMFLSNTPGKESYTRPVEGGFNIPALNPTIVYGKGEATLVRVKNEYPFANENSLNRWAATDTQVSGLARGYAYYTFDIDKQVLKLQSDEATIPAGQVYVAVPDSCYDTLGSAPATIKFGQDDAVISGIHAASVVEAAKAAVKGIYTLDGRRVEAMKEGGVYIFDGRKVIYRKK